VQALEKLGNDEVGVRVVHSASAASPNPTCAGRSVGRADHRLQRPRQQAGARGSSAKGVEIRYYNIIYDLVDDIKAAMSGLLTPSVRETFIGNAQILEVFNITKVGKVAGCRVTEGKVERGAAVACCATTS
jgi:translation initiation factor IF-2